MEIRTDLKAKNKGVDIALFTILIVTYLVASFFSIHAIFHPEFLLIRFCLTIAYLLFWIFLICFYGLKKDVKKVKAFLVIWGITIIGNLMLFILEVIPDSMESFYDIYNWIAFIVWGLLAAPLYGIVNIVGKDFPLIEMTILAFAFLIPNLIFYLRAKKSPKKED